MPPDLVGRIGWAALKEKLTLERFGRDRARGVDASLASRLIVVCNPASKPENVYNHYHDHSSCAGTIGV